MLSATSWVPAQRSAGSSNATKSRPIKRPGIVNDPNDWCDGHDDSSYIVDFIKKVTRVSVDTMAIVDHIAEESQLAIDHPVSGPR